MKFLRPTPVKKSDSSAERSAAPSSFGQRRAEEMNSRLQKAQTERKKLVRAEFASEGTVKDMVGIKRAQVDRSISRLQTRDTEEHS